MNAIKPASPDIEFPVTEHKNKSICSILIVDDESGIRQLNTEILTEAGYKVETANDGASAWRRLNISSYDLLITDNDMPKMSGIELVKKLRAAKILLPVILMSGTLPTEELEKHPWLKIHSLLSKPYSVTDLLNKVEAVFKTTDSATTLLPAIVA